MSDPYLLARARALRTVPVPADRAELTQLRCAADDVERRLVDVVTPDGTQELMTGWAPDVEPASGALGDNDVHRTASTVRLLTLACCIRHCWPDPSQPLYPGQPAAQQDVLAALTPLQDTLAPRDGAAVLGQTGHFLTALRFLRACGHLAADVGDGMIRLGPMVALWSERDVAELRNGYDILPAPRKG
ncbi:hypothetical protein [Streptomyces sp. ME19-01-6]|uniref:hypothetical protein n=1 Tax=Streptomyces sp. ME19-01-6 TaxID=3028686 RepID=UPI0029B745B2|nr:hypothetical protein [Streptomyces sp. ME19-01-6]MDX3231840.1 hypothetical protein [Streptomyces sp. ME19-01-6]